MKKVLLVTEKPFTKEAVADIKKIVETSSYSFATLEKYKTTSELLEAVKDANAVIIRSDKVTSEVITAAKKLEIIVRAGAGYDNVDLKAANNRKVVVMNTPGQNSNAVAELALGMMVFMARCGYQGGSGSELKGKSLGIHAFGNVGRNIARIAQGFDMKVSTFDPFIDKAFIEKEGVSVFTDVNDMYKSCQYISLNIPVTEKTKKSINYDLLSRMPKNAVVVNTARKEVIDEDGLLKLMVERPDFTYITDIAPDRLDEFKKFEGRFFATPKKMGAETKEANINAGLAAANQIVRFFKSGDTKYKVN